MNFREAKEDVKEIGNDFKRKDWKSLGKGFLYMFILLAVATLLTAVLSPQKAPLVDNTDNNGTVQVAIGNSAPVNQIVNQVPKPYILDFNSSQDFFSDEYRTTVILKIRNFSEKTNVIWWADKDTSEKITRMDEPTFDTVINFDGITETIFTGVSYSKEKIDPSKFVFDLREDI